MIAPVTLEGRIVRLESLSLAHVAGLAAVGLEPELWRWIPTQVANEREMHEYVETALDELRRGVSLPFAIVELKTGRVIGSTRYGNIAPEHKRLEIGWTWYARDAQRTGANTEAKYLLLTHAFDVLGMHRVELKTDALNEKSRNAILRIGAKQEGIFRRHLVCTSGRVRDTVYFSIIDSEWPAVRERLQSMMQRGP